MSTTIDVTPNVITVEVVTQDSIEILITPQTTTVELSDGVGILGNYVDVTNDQTIGGIKSFIDKVLADPGQNYGTSTGFWFGDGDTGFYESADDDLIVGIANTGRFQFQEGDLRGLAGAGAPSMRNEVASSTNPVYAFDIDPDTGLGRAGTDQLSLIAGGVEVARVDSLGITIDRGQTTNNMGFLFGDTDSGLTQNIDDRMHIRVGGTNMWQIQDTRFFGTGNYSPFLQRNSSNTIPAYSFYVDEDTGIGRADANILYLMAGGVEAARFGSATIDFNLPTTFNSDVTFAGTTTIVSSVNLEVEDPIVALGAEQVTPLLDLGFLFTRYASPSASTGNLNYALIWDEDGDKLVFGSTQDDAAVTDVTFEDELFSVDTAGNIANVRNMDLRKSIYGSWFQILQGSGGGIGFGSGHQIRWDSNSTNISDSLPGDTGLTRDSAGYVKITDGNTGLGGLKAQNIFAANYMSPTGDVLLNSSGQTMTLGSSYVQYTIIGNSTYNNTSGSEVPVSITPTYNQASGDAANTDLLINRTETTVGSGAQYLIDAQVGGVSQFYVNTSGLVDVNVLQFGSGNYNIAISGSILAIKGEEGIAFSHAQNTGVEYIYRFKPNISQTVNSSSLHQKYLSITPIYDQTGTAGATDLLINRTETAVGSGAQYLIDAQVGGASKFYVTTEGRATFASQVYAPTFRTSSPSDILNLFGAYNATQGTGVKISGVSFSATTGSQNPVAITPTYNQTSGDAANTDLLINRTETAVGSGAQNFIDCQVGGVSKFSVTNNGALFANGLYGTLYTTFVTPTSGNTTLTIQNRGFSIADNAVEMSIGTFSNSTGQTNAVAILPTYNSSGDAANTDLLINRTVTATGSGIQNFIDCQINGTSAIAIKDRGLFRSIEFDNAGYSAQIRYYQNKLQMIGSDGFHLYYNGAHSSTDALFTYAKLSALHYLNASSGDQKFMELQPHYEQTGTAGSTDLLISREEVSVGSGVQRFLDCHVAASSKFRIESSGNFFATDSNGDWFKAQGAGGTSSYTNEFVRGQINLQAGGDNRARMTLSSSCGQLFLENASEIRVHLSANSDSYVKGNLILESVGYDPTPTNTVAITEVAIDSFDSAVYRSARYTVQITNNTDSAYHTTEILLVHDSTDAYITEYGTLFTGAAPEATFDASINSAGEVELLATPASTDDMDFKVVRHAVTV